MFAGDIVNKKTALTPETPIAEAVAAYAALKAKTDIRVGVIRAAAAEVIAEQSSAAGDYRKGKQESLNFLLGMVLRKLKAKADTEKVRKIILELLG